MREPPQSWLRDVTGLRGRFPGSASDIISLVELSLPRTAHVRPAGTVCSPPPDSALLFSRDAHRHTPEVAAVVVAQTCERLLTMREPGLRPTWGLDARNPPAVDAHEGTKEDIREAHRDRHTVDCGNSGMSPDFDMLQSLAGDTSPLEIDGSDSDKPTDAPSEPAPPPHPAAMGNASPVRGLGEAEDSAMVEGVEPAGRSAGLDEGEAPGSGGAGVVCLLRGCRLGVWFGFVRDTLLPAIGTCVVLAFGAMPGRCCFLRVTHYLMQGVQI